MQKRHLVVGAVMLLASVVSYGFVRMTAASPAMDADPPSGASIGIGAATPPLVVPVSSVDSHDLLTSLSDTTMMFAAGVALFSLAAGVRRHSC